MTFLWSKISPLAMTLPPQSMKLINQLFLEAKEARVSGSFEKMNER
jgi:hypothetical protein